MIIIVKARWKWEVKHDVQLQPRPHPLGQYLNVMIDFNYWDDNKMLIMMSIIVIIVKAWCAVATPATSFGATRAETARQTARGKVSWRWTEFETTSIVYFDFLLSLLLCFFLPPPSIMQFGWVVTSDGTTNWKVHFDGILLPEPLQQLALLPSLSGKADNNISHSSFPPPHRPSADASHHLSSQCLLLQIPLGLFLIVVLYHHYSLCPHRSFPCLQDLVFPQDVLFPPKFPSFQGRLLLAARWV